MVHNSSTHQMEGNTHSTAHSTAILLSYTEVDAVAVSSTTAGTLSWHAICFWSDSLCDSRSSCSGSCSYCCLRSAAAPAFLRRVGCPNATSTKHSSVRAPVKASPPPAGQLHRHYMPNAFHICPAPSQAALLLRQKPSKASQSWQRQAGSAHSKRPGGCLQHSPTTAHTA